MSVTNGESVVTKEILNEYHQAILPYLGGGGGSGATYTAGDGIKIENNEINTDNMLSEDMAEVASPMPSVMSRRFKYSTDEQIVGTWIDGKPIYQKTIDCGANPIGRNDGTVIATIPDMSIGFIKCAYLTGSGNTGNIISLPRILPISTAYEVSVNIAGNNITYNSGDSTGSYGNVIVTVQYTKTTD